MSWVNTVYPSYLKIRNTVHPSFPKRENIVYTNVPITGDIVYPRVPKIGNESVTLNSDVRSMAQCFKAREYNISNIVPG